MTSLGLLTSVPAHSLISSPTSSVRNVGFATGAVRKDYANQDESPSGPPEGGLHANILCVSGNAAFVHTVTAEFSFKCHLGVSVQQSRAFLNE